MYQVTFQELLNVKHENSSVPGCKLTNTPIPNNKDFCTPSIYLEQVTTAFSGREEVVGQFFSHGSRTLMTWSLPISFTFPT